MMGDIKQKKLPAKGLPDSPKNTCPPDSGDELTVLGFNLLVRFQIGVILS